MISQINKTDFGQIGVQDLDFLKESQMFKLWKEFVAFTEAFAMSCSLDDIKQLSDIRRVFSLLE